MIFPRERSGALASLLFEGNDGTMELDRNFLMGSITKKLLFIFWNHTTDDVLHAMTWQMAMPRWGRGNCRGEMFGAGPRTKEENYFGETAENQNSFEGL